MDAPKVRELLGDIIDRFPDSTNPTDGGRHCVYTKAVGTEGPPQHCLIGQLAAEQGWADPGFCSDRVTVVAKRLRWPITDDALDVLRAAQNRADDNTRRWAEVRAPEGFPFTPGSVLEGL